MTKPTDPRPYRSPPPVDPPVAAPQARTPHDPIGWALVVAPAAGGLAQLILPGVDAGLAVIATVVVTLVLIGIDASLRGMKARLHVAGAILFWVVGYPHYMHRRAAFGAPRRLFLALGSMVAFFLGGLVRR